MTNCLTILELLLKQFQSDWIIASQGNFALPEIPKLPTITWVPEPRPSKGFVGREKELKQLHSALASKQQLFLISGIGGVGKTELVKSFFYRLDNPAIVFWINAETSQTLQKSIHEIGKCFKIPITDTTSKHRAPLDILRDVVGYLEKHHSSAKHWIIVLDNLDEVDEGMFKLMEKCMKYLKTFIVATARKRDVLNGEENNKIHLVGLNPSDSIRLVGQSLPDGRSGEIQELCGILENYPLALRQAIAYIKMEKSMKDNLYGISTFLEEYKSRGTETLGQLPKLVEYQETVLTVWNMTIARIEQRYGDTGRDALHILEMLAFINPEGIAPLLLKTFLVSSFHEDFEGFRVEAGIHLLYQFSLIQKSGDIISIHRVVQQIARERVRHLPAEKVSEAFTNCGFNCKCQSNLCSFWEGVEILECDEKSIMQILEVWKHTCEDESIVAAFPTVAIKIFDRMAQLSMVQDSLQFAKTSYDVLEKVLGKVDYNCMEMGRREGIALKNNGRYTQALECYLRIYDRQYETLGKEHRSTLETGMYIASVYERLKNPESALKWAKNTMNSQLVVQGSRHSSTMDTKHVLGNILCAMKKYEVAKAVNEEVYEWRVTNLGPTHMRTLVSLHNIGYCSYALGQYGEARDFFEKVLKNWVHGEDLVQALMTKALLAKCVFHLGRMKEGIAQLCEVFKKYESILGENHPETNFTREELKKLIMEMEAKKRKCCKGCHGNKNRIWDRLKRVCFVGPLVGKRVKNKI